MFDLNNMDSKELIELKNKINLTLAEKMRLDDSFYSKILKLKEQLSSFIGKSLSLTVDGYDILVHFRFDKGVNFVFDELDYSQFNIDEYNEEEFERIYIESLERESEVENFYIPLNCDFVATADVSSLEDRFGYGFGENNNIVFIIRTDTIDYVFEF